MGGWHGAGPVNKLDEHGEPQKVGEGAVDTALLIWLSSLQLPENPPSLLIVVVTVNGRGRSEVMAANSRWFLLRKTGYCAVSGTSNSPIWVTNSESGICSHTILKFSTNPAIADGFGYSSHDFTIHVHTIHSPLLLNGIAPFNL